MKLLIVGGAGYIGSHMVKMLGRLGFNLTILDDLSSGSKGAVLYGDFVFGNCGDRNLLDWLFSRHFDAVMHFASFIQVGESVHNPQKYYLNNFVNTMTLLDAMRDHGINNFIFSSTAAIFGNPDYIPIDELHPQNPTNAYGRSKLMVEHLLNDYIKSYKIKSICLRYFNAAGADPECEIGECHFPETHIIPLLMQVASGRMPKFSVFGRTHDTPDGTCIRDFVHVQDLCAAHLLALQSLVSGGESHTYNVGIGRGYSVQKVIDMALKVTGRKIKIVDESAREGDVACLVSDSSLIRHKLGWHPQFADIKKIIEHAWQWELKCIS